MASDIIHIGLCADENFALPFGVCLTSIFESNKDELLKIHVITQGFSNETLLRINQTERAYGRNGSVEIHKISDEIFSQYPLSNQFPKAIYFRYIFAKLLPVGIEKLIYIDSDTVILSSLRVLWNIPLDETQLLGAVEDRNGDDILIRNRIGRWHGVYYNSGMLLMNLRLWRKIDAFRILADFILNNQDVCVYPDQDAINVVFADKFVSLPYQYNFSMSFIAPFETFRLHLSKKELLEFAFDKIIILHYAAEVKPWYLDSKHPLLFIWKHFYRISAWNNIKLKYRHSIIHRVLTKVIVYVLYRDKQCAVNSKFIYILEKYQNLYLK